MNLERLQELNGQLTSLLADPEPGLITWNLAVAKVVRGMAVHLGLLGLDLGASDER